MNPWRIAAVLLALAGGAWAQADKGPSPAPSPGADVKTLPGAAVGHSLTAPDVEAFFDGVIPLQLERSDVAGATVLVTQDGKVLLQKGYGFADEKARKPVDPVSTIFRLASISKLFTWTSVMQLAEQGRLDLDADVNGYLDFKIRPAFGKPITLRNLMTHSGGFEEEDRDVIVTDPKKVVSLRDFLVRNQPNRLFAPGTETAYSNYGVGLAGYIVERVSGEPFEQYVAEHIFAPLGMVHSSFYQPVEKPLEKLPSDGYRADTTRKPLGFEIFNPAPAGGISSTAYDMGRFGQAFLNGGELDGRRILKPETVAQMWTPQFRASPDLEPICMGFYEAWRDNVHWIGHQGDLIAFHSMFYLQPERKLTLFLSYNSSGSGSRVRAEILGMFTDRYFPGVINPPVISLSRSQLQEIEGTYETTRRADSTRGHFMGLMEQDVAKIDKDGALDFGQTKDLRGHVMKWKPIGKDLWQEVDGQHRLFAIRGPDGKIVRIANDFAGQQMQRMPWWEHAAWVLPAMGLSLLVLLLVLLAPLFRAGHRLFLRRRPRPLPQPGTAWLPLSAKIAAMAWVIPLIALFILVSRIGPDAMPPTTAWDKWFVVMNLLVGLALLLGILPMVSGVRVWRRRHLRWITKLKFSTVALSCAMLSWAALHYHLIGPVRI